MTETPTGTTLVVSYNRPLTRDAESSLEGYGIVEKTSPREWGRWTVLELEQRPDRDVLDEHELRIDESPDRAFETDHGELVAIYPDRVVVDGVENTLSPEEAIEYAEANSWDEVDPKNG